MQLNGRPQITFNIVFFVCTRDILCTWIYKSRDPNRTIIYLISNVNIGPDDVLTTFNGELHLYAFVCVLLIGQYSNIGPLDSNILIFLPLII